MKRILVLFVVAATLAAPAANAAPRTVTIAMHDPGCHWFLVRGEYKTRLTVRGATRFRNLDEAPLTFAGRGFSKRVAVGRTLIVSKPGVYRIRMVRQAADDNVLILTVR